MANKPMNGVHAVRIGIYLSQMVNGRKKNKNRCDFIVAWPLKKDGGKFVYGPSFDDGFSDDETMYSGTYQKIRDGVYKFEMPEGVTARGVAKYGESGAITVINLHHSSRAGSTGEAEIRGAGVDNPPGGRWKLEHGYKRTGG